MKRRTFLLSAVAAAGALVVGWSLLPAGQRLRPARPRQRKPGRADLNGWVSIATDGSVTVLMAKSEMGQGVHTALAMILADELDADWNSVRIEMAPIDPIYNNVAVGVDGLPFHPDDHGAIRRSAEWMTAKVVRAAGVMITGGSTSIKDLWMPMRQAGASARAMLVAAAASQWGAKESTLRVSAGAVLHSDGRRTAFGDLVERAAALPVPTSARLKSFDEFTLIGTPTRRLEAADKLTGDTVYGIDVHEPGMLYASVIMCPTLGGRVRALQADDVKTRPGVRAVVPLEGYNGGTAGFAVIADTPWRAMQAARSVRVEWDHGAAATVSSAALLDQFASTLATEDGHAYHTAGNATAALARASTTVTAEYRAPFLAHAALEPINCTVKVGDDGAVVWASTQTPTLARNAVASVLDLDAERVDLRVQFIGGGFGRRLDVDFIAQAAVIAAAAKGVAVQTIWSREQDITHDFYRPACVSRFTAGLTASGSISGWSNTSAGPAIVPAFLHRQLGTPSVPFDKTTSEGAFDQPYALADARIGHVIVETPIPVGFWRSVGHSHQAFFVESFLDELATAAAKDPIAFRLGLLTAQPRVAAVLRAVAERAGWGTPFTPPAPGLQAGRGVALHRSFGSTVAQVADVTVDSANRIRVHRVFCAIDCGVAVNPAGVRQQMEGGIIFGLSAALHGDITIVNGQVRQSNFHEYPALRMNESPSIDVAILPSTEPPEGVGEPGVPPIAPAVANAVFAATGVRIRTLPLRLP